MNNYELGGTYSLAFVNQIVINDRTYIVVSDGEKDYTVKPYDYQTEYSSIPKILSCYVSKVGLNGSTFFEQNRESILNDRYSTQFGNSHDFVVDEVCIDQNTKCVFYTLSDEFGVQHRYYPLPEEIVKKVGDSISLIVKGVVPAKNGKNNARLDLVLPSKVSVPIIVAPKPVYPKQSGKKCFGCENEKKEFKSSIVYPAGTTSPDIDTQLGIICRTIAGFMNANGGTLYIGVSDNGYICGIENDYSHLNDGEDNYTYKENDDCYLQKITNRICKLLGRTAGTLINMRIESEDDKKYCIVNIRKASNPIWFDGNKLFVRVVTSNRKLLKDEITQFVLDRTTKSAFAKLKEAEVPIVKDAYEDTQTTSAVTPTVPVPAPAPAVNISHQAKKSSAWRNITLYNNGEWSFQKDEISGSDVVSSIAIPGDARKNNYILILAYENGYIEATSLKTLLYGKNGLLPEGKRRGRGLYLPNGKMVSAFCANKNDMLLLTSEVAGDKYVKALDVDLFHPHESMGKGYVIVKENGAVLIEATHILNDIGARISLQASGIFIEKHQRYTKGGVKLNALSSTHRQLIDTLTGSNSVA